MGWGGGGGVKHYVLVWSSKCRRIIHLKYHIVIQYGGKTGLAYDLTMTLTLDLYTLTNYIGMQRSVHEPVIYLLCDGRSERGGCGDWLLSSAESVAVQREQAPRAAAHSGQVPCRPAQLRPILHLRRLQLPGQYTRRRQGNFRFFVSSINVICNIQCLLVNWLVHGVRGRGAVTLSPV